MDYFVSMPEVAHVYAHGPTKSAVKLKSGLDVDVRIVPEESYGAALMYFTGSKTTMSLCESWRLKRDTRSTNTGCSREPRRKKENWRRGKLKKKFIVYLAWNILSPKCAK